GRAGREGGRGVAGPPLRDRERGAVDAPRARWGRERPGGGSRSRSARARARRRLASFDGRALTTLVSRRTPRSRRRHLRVVLRPLFGEPWRSSPNLTGKPRKSLHFRTVPEQLDLRERDRRRRAFRSPRTPREGGFGPLRL